MTDAASAGDAAPTVEAAPAEAAPATEETKPVEEPTQQEEAPKEEPEQEKATDKASKPTAEAQSTEEPTPAAPEEATSEGKPAEEPAQDEGKTAKKAKRSSILQRLLAPLAQKKKAETPVPKEDKQDKPIESPNEDTTPEEAKDESKPKETKEEPKAEEKAPKEEPKAEDAPNESEGVKVDDAKPDGAAPDKEKLGRRLSLKANKVRTSFFERTKKAIEDAAGKIEHHQKKTGAEVSDEKAAEAPTATSTELAHGAEKPAETAVKQAAAPAATA